MRKANISLAIVAVLILAGFTDLAIHSGVASQRLQMKTIKLQSAEQKLKSINIQYEKLDTQLKTESSINKDTINDLKAQQDKLQKEKQDLEAKLQAKAEAQQKLAAQAAATAQKASIAQVAYAAEALPAGSHTDWMAAAGIAAGDYGYADYIINHEGHFDACVRYGNIHDCSGWQYGTAYGVCQSLPGSKMASAGADWATNPITQLRWCNSYATSRYGGWANAYYYWVNHKVW